MYFPKNDTVIEYVDSSPMPVFGGNHWTNQSITPIGLPFSGSMAYDEQLGVVVLFGLDPETLFPPGTHTLAYTWTWDGKVWRRVGSIGGLGGQESESLVYDLGRHRLILFGGILYTDGGPVLQNDLWEFDGHTWKELQPDDFFGV